MRDGDSGRELAAGERDGFCLEPAADGFPHGRQGIEPDSGIYASRNDNLVFAPEGVVPLAQQVCHSVTGRHIRQEPEGVLQIRQEPHIRVGKWGAGSGLEAFDRLRGIRAANDVQPLLHIVLVGEAGGFASALGGEKFIEIELIEFTTACDGEEFIRHLVSEEPHLWQGAVGVPLAGIFSGEFLLGSLLVGVGPVEDLLLDEFTGGESFERRAGEIQIRLRGDGQEIGFPLREHGEVFIHYLQAGGVFEFRLFFCDGFLLTLEEFLCRLAPCAEVVFVEHHQIPIHRMEPFILGFDVSGFVTAQQVLEGAEENQRLAGGDCRGVAAGVAGEVLPAVEVHMVFEIRLPRIFHGGFEGDHEHTLCSQLFGKLVGGEGLSKPHLRVPQKTRHGVHVLFPDRVEIVVRLLHGTPLLSPHGKGLVVRTGESATSAKLGEHRADVLDGAAHPLQFGRLKAFSVQGGAHFAVSESGSILTLGRFVQLDRVVFDVRCFELFRDALPHIARGLPDLEDASMGGIRDRVGIDAETGLGLGGENFLDGFTHRFRPRPSGESFY